MIMSYLKNILYNRLEYNAKSILGRKLQEYEKQQFLNVRSKAINVILSKAKQDIDSTINKYLEDLK